MRMLMTVLMCDVVLGAATALYLVAAWRKCKGAIAENGWHPDCADPMCGNMWLICFVPVAGILYYLISGEMIGVLSVTDKESVNGVVSVCYGKLSFVYNEGHEMG